MEGHLLYEAPILVLLDLNSGQPCVYNNNVKRAFVLAE